MVDLELDEYGNWVPKWHGFSPDALQIKAGYTGTVAEVIAISDAQIEKMRISGGVHKCEYEKELEYKDLSYWKVLVEIKEATVILCNEAKIPEKAWDDVGHKAEYDASPYHFPTFSGVGDGAISQVKDVPEMVSFGLKMATEPEEAMKLWDGIKKITPASVKKMIIGAAQAKKDKYAGGGNTMKHEVGSDAVTVVATIISVVGVKAIIAKAKEIKNLNKLANKLDDIAEEAIGKIDNAIDADAGKSLNKMLNEGEVHQNMLGYEADDLLAAQKKKGSKLTEQEVKDHIEKNKKSIEEGNLDEFVVSEKVLPDGTIEIGKGKKGAWNKTLNNPLKPNSKYKVGKNTYETDNLGRVKGVKGELDLKTADRNNYQQSKGGNSALKDGVNGDQGGHMIAAIFDGAGEQINYVPMKGSLNQGAWKSMEAGWQNALKSGKKVEVDIKIIYGTDKRPIKFEIEWETAGEFFSKEFVN